MSYLGEFRLGLASLAVLVLCFCIYVARKRGLLNSPPRPAAVPQAERAPRFPYPPSWPSSRWQDYRIEPFYDDEYLYTLADFREALKTHSFNSGIVLWASATGHWVEIATGERVRAEPVNIRAGETPPPFFTHIEYLPK